MLKYTHKIVDERQFQPSPDLRIECPYYNLDSRGPFNKSYKASLNHISNNQLENSSPKSNLGKIVFQNSQGIRTKAKTKD